MYHFSQPVKFYFSDQRHRFNISVATDFHGSFLNLQNAISYNFQQIPLNQLELFWQDCESDLFRLQSDEDVKTALKDHSNTQLLRVYSNLKQQSTPFSTPFRQTPGGWHHLQEDPMPNVIDIPMPDSHMGTLPSNCHCNGCGVNLRDSGYQCQECPEFRLCAVCKGRRFHDQHAMIPIGGSPVGRAKSFCRCSKSQASQGKGGEEEFCLCSSSAHSSADRIAAGSPKEAESSGQVDDPPPMERRTPERSNPQYVPQDEMTPESDDFTRRTEWEPADPDDRGANRGDKEESPNGVDNSRRVETPPFERRSAERSNNQYVEVPQTEEISKPPERDDFIRRTEEEPEDSVDQGVKRGDTDREVIPKGVDNSERIDETPPFKRRSPERSTHQYVEVPQREEISKPPERDDDFIRRTEREPEDSVDQGVKRGDTDTEEIPKGPDTRENIDETRPIDVNQSKDVLKEPEQRAVVYHSPIAKILNDWDDQNEGVYEKGKTNPDADVRQESVEQGDKLANTSSDPIPDVSDPEAVQKASEFSHDVDESVKEIEEEMKRQDAAKQLAEHQKPVTWATGIGEEIDHKIDAVLARQEQVKQSHKAAKTDKENRGAAGGVVNSLQIDPSVEDLSQEGRDDVSLHPGVICADCGGTPRDRRYKCLLCPNYDLCGECEAKHQHDHHPMTRICDSNNDTWRSAFPTELYCFNGSDSAHMEAIMRDWQSRYHLQLQAVPTNSRRENRVNEVFNSPSEEVSVEKVILTEAQLKSLNQ